MGRSPSPHASGIAFGSVVIASQGAIAQIPWMRLGTLVMHLNLSAMLVVVAGCPAPKSSSLDATVVDAAAHADATMFVDGAKIALDTGFMDAGASDADPDAGLDAGPDGGLDAAADSDAAVDADATVAPDASPDRDATPGADAASDADAAINADAARVADATMGADADDLADAAMDAAAADVSVADAAATDAGFNVDSGSIADAGVCVTHADCQDNAFCNGQELCNMGVCVPGTPPNCVDMDPCSIDQCDEVMDVCTNTADPTCIPDCSSDRFENDDTLVTARPLTAGTYPALTSCNGDEDWFAVTVGNNELIEVLLSFQDAIGDVNLHLYDSAGAQVDAAQSGTDDERVAYTTRAAGTYYVRVVFNVGGGDDDDVDGNTYDLTLGLGAPCTDRYEDNDLLASATPIATGIETALRACPSDEDWYEVQVDDNELLTVSSLFDDAMGNIDLRLYNNQGTQVAASLSGTDDEALAYAGQYAGPYFVRVLFGSIHEDDAMPGNDYTLEVVTSSACDDVFENNDSLAAAAVVGPGSYVDLTTCPADEDWYAITAGNNELIRLDVRFAHVFGNIDLRLYDSQGTQVSAALSGTDDESIVYTTPRAGTYYVRVLLGGGDDAIPGNGYALDVDVGTPCSDIFEDNDDFVGTRAIGSGSFNGLSACPNDEDFYALPLSAPGTIVVDAAFLHSAGNIDLRLYDATGTQVAASLSGSDNEHLEFIAPVAGQYNLRVSLAEDDATPGNDYTMTVTGSDPCPATSCAAQTAECGALHDGCGIVLDCGACPGMQLCGNNNQCGCMPASCASAGANCGLFSDGCGATLNCGTCTTPQICGGSRVPNVCAAPTCLPDMFEDNDDFAGASAIAVGSYEDLTLCPPDLDYFAVSTVSNDVLIVTADFVHVEGDVNLRLYDAAFSQVDGSFSGANRERIVFTSAGGTYYVRADMTGADDVIPGAEYDLRVETASCTDALEDNDSMATAATVSSGQIAGLFACPNDEDWYRVPVANNQIIDARIRFLDVTGNIDLRLYDSAGRQIGASLSGSDDERVTFSTPAAGDYFLRVLLVESDDDQTPGNGYTLELDTTSPCTDAFEDNDDRATAAWLVSGMQSGLTACPSDEDWYRVEVGDNQLIVFNALFSHAEGNVDLRLYDGRGAQVAAALSGTDNERIAYTSLNSGPHFLRVLLAGNDGDPPGVTYDLDVSLGAPCTDVLENNDSFDGAYTLGSGNFTNLVSCPNDEDWYEIDATAGSTVTVALSFTHAAGNVDLRLYDPGGSQVASSLSGTDDELIIYVPAISGSHFVRVVLASDDPTPGSTYAMTVSGVPACAPSITCASSGAQCGPVHDGCAAFVDCGTCAGGAPCSVNNICGCMPQDCAALGASCGFPEDGCGTAMFCGICTAPAVCGGAYVNFSCDLPDCIQDALEDNDTRQTAPETTSGLYSNLTACTGDEDWYELDVENNTLIEIDLFFDAARGNVDARLVNASGTQLDASLSGTSNERIIYTTPARGTYFLRTTFAGDDDEVPGNRYDLRLNTTRLCTDVFEDNDRDVDATPLGSGNYTALMACPHDEDWFVFAMGNNELIEADVLFTDALGDIDLRLYDASGAQIAASLSGTNDERIVHTTAQAGSYFLRVIAPEAGDDATPGNTYSMPLSVGVPCTDGFEDNDVRANAAPISAGTLTGLVACPADEDWYRVDTAPGRTLTINLAFVHAAGNVDVRLYNASGGQVAASLSGTDNEQIVHTTADAGPFYVRVNLGSDDATPSNGYTLELIDAP